MHGGGGGGQALVVTTTKKFNCQLPLGGFTFIFYGSLVHCIYVQCSAGMRSALQCNTLQLISVQCSSGQ